MSIVLEKLPELEDFKYVEPDFPIMPILYLEFLVNKKRKKSEKNEHVAEKTDTFIEKTQYEESSDAIEQRRKVFEEYDILQAKYPRYKSSMPEFNEYSSPEVLSQKIERLRRKLSIASSVENYRNILISFILSIEFLLGKITDLDGFASSKMESIEIYDELLVEITKKPYLGFATKWPVEIKLLMLISMQLVIFVVTKYLSKTAGSENLTMFMKNAAEKPKINFDKM